MIYLRETGRVVLSDGSDGLDGLRQSYGLPA